MKISLNSIGLKFTAIFILLTLLDMAIFSVLTWRNQTGLIAENSRSRAAKTAGEIISSMKKIIGGTETGKIRKSRNPDRIVKKVADMALRKNYKFVIFNEDGALLYKSGTDITALNEEILNFNNTAAGGDAAGDEYYTAVDKNNYEISCYFPFKTDAEDYSRLFLKIKLEGPGDRLKNLYDVIIFNIVIIGLLHALIGFVLFRLFIMPVSSLNKKGIEVMSGNYEVRTDVRRADEIGSLGELINSMANSIQKKNKALKRQGQIEEYELALAGGIQKIIYPELTGNERFNISLFHRAPGKVTGDYYEAFKLGDSKYGFLIADITGRGVPAALYAIIAREIFRKHAPLSSDPAELFRNVNLELFEILGAGKSDRGTFLSAFYLIIDGKNRILYCNAGHIQPFHVSIADKNIYRLDTNGFLIGISKDSGPQYETGIANVRQGDKIIFFTDGIVEMKNDRQEEYGTKRLIRAISNSYENSSIRIMSSIIKDLGSFTDINTLTEDATLFIVEIK